MSICSNKYIVEFITLLKCNASKHGIYKVFKSFLELSSITLNTKSEFEKIILMFTNLVMTFLNSEYQDWLSYVFEELFFISHARTNSFILINLKRKFT